MDFLWNSDAGTAPALDPVIGQPLLWAGILSPATFCMRFAQYVVVAEAAAAVGDFRALSVKIGQIKVGADFSRLEADPVVTVDAHCKALVGKRFSAMDADVFVFDGAYGVKVMPGQIRFVQSSVAQ